MPYVDDVIIYSKTLEEHIQKLETFFERMEKAGFFLKLRMSISNARDGVPRTHTK